VACRLAVALLVVLAAGCGSGPKGGDPGNRRLRELAADPVFAARSPGAVDAAVARTPARYRTPAFQTAGWDGPSVVVTFRSGAPPRDVYRYYAERAAAAGWLPGSAGALGLTDLWRKTFGGGAHATLLLSLLDLRKATGLRRYRLSGGISVA